MGFWVGFGTWTWLKVTLGEIDVNLAMAESGLACCTADT